MFSFLFLAMTYYIMLDKKITLFSESTEWDLLNRVYEVSQTRRTRISRRPPKYRLSGRLRSRIVIRQIHNWKLLDRLFVYQTVPKRLERLKPTCCIIRLLLVGKPAARESSACKRYAEQKYFRI